MNGVLIGYGLTVAKIVGLAVLIWFVLVAIVIVAALIKWGK